MEGVAEGRGRVTPPFLTVERGGALLPSLTGGVGGGSALLDWKMDILKEQVETSVARLGEFSGVRHVRRHLANSPLFKGIPDFRQTRIRMLRAETVDELFEIMEQTRTLLKTINEN